ncbi:Domain of Uncharacterised Function (DUF1540) [uncultured Clostridium sp.]|nr:Domain of Uncharacterised Function (DUF1540) [uncultured Clostridium sp.]SCJ10213.1 Domain of Uncharacterised Function (DUF1540) [uncultured Clostridium sp.]
MSNPITCSATTCTYNNSGGCYASGIKVDGSKADTTSETICATYQDRESSSFANSEQSSSIAQTSSISCAATNCKHNHSGACKAEAIHINMNDASCETFVSR